MRAEGPKQAQAEGPSRPGRARPSPAPSPRPLPRPPSPRPRRSKHAVVLQAGDHDLRQNGDAGPPPRPAHCSGPASGGWVGFWVHSCCLYGVLRLDLFEVCCEHGGLRHRGTRRRSRPSPPLGAPQAREAPGTGKAQPLAGSRPRPAPPLPALPRHAELLRDQNRLLPSNRDAISNLLRYAFPGRLGVVG